MKGLSRGRLRVAAVSTAKYFIPRLVGSFCRLHPAIDVSLEVLNRDGVVARLRDNRDDIYIMSMPPDASTSRTRCSWKIRSSSSRRAAPGSAAASTLARAEGPALHPARARLRHAHGDRPAFRASAASSPTCASNSAATRRSRRRWRAASASASSRAMRCRAAGTSGCSTVEGFPISSRWHVVHPQGQAAFAHRRRLPGASAGACRQA